MEAALWAFFKTDTFYDGCLAAVILGDDADTTGVIYGQLAGAFYGFEGILKEWVINLKKNDLIAEFSQKLYGLHETIGSI